MEILDQLPEQIFSQISSRQWCFEIINYKINYRAIAQIIVQEYHFKSIDFVEAHLEGVRFYKII